MSQRYVFTNFRGTVESRQTLSIFHIKWLDSVNSVYCIAEYSLVQTKNAQDNSVCMLAERWVHMNNQKQTTNNLN